MSDLQLIIRVSGADNCIASSDSVQHTYSPAGGWVGSTIHGRLSIRLSLIGRPMEIPIYFPTEGWVGRPTHERFSIRLSSIGRPMEVPIYSPTEGWVGSPTHERLSIHLILIGRPMEVPVVLRLL